MKRWLRGIKSESGIRNMKPHSQFIAEYLNQRPEASYEEAYTPARHLLCPHRNTRDLYRGPAHSREFRYLDCGEFFDKDVS